MAKKKEDLGGVWRTVGGRRIFIKDGQDLYEAMNDSGKFTNLKRTNSQRKKEYRIVDNKSKKVLATFNEDQYEEGYKKMREMGQELKAKGEEDNLLYKEYKVDGKTMSEQDLRKEFDKELERGNIEKGTTYSEWKKGVVDDRNSNVKSEHSKKDTLTEQINKEYDEIKSAERKEWMEKYAKDQYIKDVDSAKSWNEIKEITKKIDDETTRSTMERRIKNLEGHKYDKDLDVAKDYLKDNYKKMKDGTLSNLGNRFDYKKSDYDKRPQNDVDRENDRNNKITEAIEKGQKDFDPVAFEKWKEENNEKIASYYSTTYSKDLKNINKDVWNSIAKDIYDEEKMPEKINKQEKQDQLLAKASKIEEIEKELSKVQSRVWDAENDMAGEGIEESRWRENPGYNEDCYRLVYLRRDLEEAKDEYWKEKNKINQKRWEKELNSKSNTNMTKDGIYIDKNGAKIGHSMVVQYATMNHLTIEEAKRILGVK